MPIAAYRDGVFTLLVQTRLEPRNDVATLIAALRRLPATARVRLLICGDGPERGRLQAQAAGLDVHLGPQLARRADLAASCDAYFCRHHRLAPHGAAGGLGDGATGAGVATSRGCAGWSRQASRAPWCRVTTPRPWRKRWSRRCELRMEPQRQRMGQAAREQAAAFAWERIAVRVAAFYDAVMARRERGQWGGSELVSVTNWPSCRFRPLRLQLGQKLLVLGRGQVGVSPAGQRRRANAAGGRADSARPW